VTGLQTGCPGCDSSQHKILLVSTVYRLVPGPTQPHSRCITVALKWQGRETYHSPPPIALVHSDNFTPSLSSTPNQFLNLFHWTRRCSRGAHDSYCECFVWISATTLDVLIDGFHVFLSLFKQILEHCLDWAPDACGPFINLSAYPSARCNCWQCMRESVPGSMGELEI
jgi:hypothetical protein